MGRLLAQKGAKVTGIDSSAGLIRAARSHEQSDTLAVSFDVGSVESLPYGPDEFDVVVANHLMNDLPDPSSAIREFSRVLRDGERLIILMLRPCFYTKRADHQNPENSLIADTYFRARSVSQKFVVDGLHSPADVTVWMRPLEYYTEALQQSGFAITSLTEPHPTPEMIQADAWWRTSFTRPLFMLITAQLRQI